MRSSLGWVIVLFRRLNNLLTTYGAGVFQTLTTSYASELVPTGLRPYLTT